MNKYATKFSLLVAALLGLSATAWAQTTPASNRASYIQDSRGQIVRDPFGLCWHTGYWSPAMAIEECEPDLVKKPAAPPPAPRAQPAPPPPPAAAPAPKPAPAPAPAPAPRPAAAKVTFAADTLFDFDRATLRPEGRTELDGLAGKIKDVKLEVIIAVGHADRVGTDRYNQRLSERRAAAVKDYLVSKGIEPNRIYTEGKGEKQPVTADKCRKMGPENRRNKKLVDCLQPDRRVEVEVIGTR